MSRARYLLAFAFGVVMTIVQFVAVGALNNATATHQDAVFTPAKSRPIIVSEPPETPTPPPSPRSVLRTLNPKAATAARQVRTSALPTLSTSTTQLSLGSVLPDLGDVGLGSIDVSVVPSEPDRPARAQQTVAPKYPSRAQRDGIEGYVIVRLSIDAQGKVKDVLVVDSEPIGVFERSARDAARRFKFEPARVGGVFVSAVIEKKIVFALQ